MPVTQLVFSCLVMFLFQSWQGGGAVPGGVLDGDSMQDSDVLRRGGRQGKQTLLGLGPKFRPPQLMHGGVGGGVHGRDTQLGGGGRGADRVSGVTVGGRIILVLSIVSTELTPPTV